MNFAMDKSSIQQKFIKQILRYYVNVRKTDIQPLLLSKCHATLILGKKGIFNAGTRGSEFKTGLLKAFGQ